MWLFTNTGFYSIVQKPGEPALTVRARARQDLEALRGYMPELGETVEGQGTDYPYRARISHAAFGLGLSRLGQDIHYSNFKAEVWNKQGIERADLYHKVWATLASGLRWLENQRVFDLRFTNGR